MIILKSIELRYCFRASTTSKCDITDRSRPLIDISISPCLKAPQRSISRILFTFLSECASLIVKPKPLIELKYNKKIRKR